MWFNIQAATGFPLWVSCLGTSQYSFIYFFRVCRITDNVVRHTVVHLIIAKAYIINILHQLSYFEWQRDSLAYPTVSGMCASFTQPAHCPISADVC